MPFSLGGWRLYLREVKLKGGSTVPIYFFSKKEPKLGRPSDLPPDWVVAVRADMGHPFVFKKQDPTAHVAARPDPAMKLGKWRLYRQHFVDDDTNMPVTAYVFSQAPLPATDGIETEPVTTLPSGVRAVLGKSGLPALLGLRPEHLMWNRKA